MGDWREHGKDYVWGVAKDKGKDKNGFPTADPNRVDVARVGEFAHQMARADRSC